MRLQLTDEQKAAAATRCARAYIESAPGSGKTTVAAERYGVARFNRADGRGVVALSFARSARGELERRVRSRWGADAIRWPHKVWTLDSLHCALVQHLLRCGIVHWPAGHTEITVIDSWRGNRGSRPIAPGGFGRVVTLQGSAVTSVRRRKQVAGYGFDNKAAYEALLASGLSTHDEIRQVLDAVIARADLAPPVRDFFLGTTKALIVDEIFDGNIVDLNIVRLAAEAGVPTTIIGDPWQALYAFRGAEPALVPRLISELAFDTFPLSTSFRFVTAEMQLFAEQLRAGDPVSVPGGAPHEVDVVLSSDWRSLWTSSNSVLPFSFGRVGNRTDAAMALLLDRVVSSHFSSLSTFGPDACVVLGLDPAVVRSDGSAAFAAVFERLNQGTEADAVAALTLLRTSVTNLGSGRISKLRPDNEAERVARLQDLARRLGNARLVPGLTIHQAKGREWEHVGLILSRAQTERLATGLSKDREGDRALYVALTRAQRAVAEV